MKYYLHDTSAFSDEKITQLYINFGYEGLGLFYTFLEKIALQEKPVNTIVLKKQLFIGKRLEKCWQFMEEIGLISSNNGETFNKQLLNFSEKYQIKKEKNRKRISEWRVKQDDMKNVTCYESVRNTSKVKESKLNRNNILSDFCKNEILEFFQYRIEIKKPFKSEKSKIMFQNQLITLSENNEETAKKILNQSISNCWQGIFELKENNLKLNYAPNPDIKNNPNRLKFQ